MRILTLSWQVPILYAIKNSLRMFSRKINLRALFAPSTTGAVCFEFFLLYYGPILFGQNNS